MIVHQLELERKEANMWQMVMLVIFDLDVNDVYDFTEDHWSYISCKQKILKPLKLYEVWSTKIKALFWWGCLPSILMDLWSIVLQIAPWTSCSVTVILPVCQNGDSWIWFYTLRIGQRHRKENLADAAGDDWLCLCGSKTPVFNELVHMMAILHATQLR